MAIQKGIGVVWGISGGLTAQASGAPLTQSEDWKIDSDVKEFKDENGDTKGMVFFNEKHELTVEVIPSGTTLAFAKGENILPAAGDLVTITDSDDAEVAGSYVFMSGDKKKSQDSEVILTLNLRKYLTNDVSATISS
jgi:hypothetical protein